MENNMKDKNTPKIPSPLLSFVPVMVLVGLLACTIRIFGGDTLDGASQIVLLTSAAVCCLIAICRCGIRWKTIETAIVSNISGVSPALLILLLIGALSGSWMVSGVIPTLVYYGIKIIHPDFFLVTTCIICALVSVMTGSSWTTIATVGIALFGIGRVQGFHEGWIAGAIISGAYFGDKVSPLSDTTVLASSVTGTPLFQHIRYMMITTVPSMAVTLAIFLIAGFSRETSPSLEIGAFMDALSGAYHISLWLLTVPLVMVVLIVRKISPVITLFLSAMAAGFAALVFQPELLHRISGLDVHSVSSLFKGLIMTFYDNTQIETGNATLNELAETHGMSGMLNTVWLIICAMCFGGSMTASGMLAGITSIFLRFMKRTAGTVSATVASGIFLNICTADQYLSILLTGDMFKNVYKQKGCESRLLSRTIEDGVTVTSPLIPWNTCGMTQATVLGVSTFTYLPYCFFNLISPLMSIIVAATGYKIKKVMTERCIID
ncbi:MAG: sodium:proton antiporter [Prevotellaceae bacterium]|jgi:NhaC family Na+:H+ antiporter|nr:sodium:proton antiporter [Prevotellaceae bacterium]